MHSNPTVVHAVVIDWHSTFETVVVGRRKSDEPFVEQGFGLIMVGGASPTSTLKRTPFVRVLPETWWKKRDTKCMFNVL